MPTVITKTPVTSNFNIFDGLLELTDYYGTAGIYSGTYSIPDSGVIGVFKVTAPSGVVIYNNTNFSSPDVIGATPLWLKSISIPTNADGSLVVGTYSIVYTSRIDDGVHTPYDLVNNASYNFQYTRPTAVITQSVDCVSPNFTTVDATDYTVNTIVPAMTRAFNLEFPYGSAGQYSPLTTGTNTISTGVFYNGTQTTVLSTDLLYTLTATGDFPTFTITDTVDGSKEVLVDCTFICAIYCCIRSVEQRMQNAQGVNQVLYETYLSQFTKVMGLVALAKLAIECGKSTEVNGYLDEIRTITECTSDCGCSGDEPSLVVGLGGVSVHVVVDGGGSPVTVTSNTVGDTTTYTVSLEQAFIDIVNASYNTTITSDDSSVTITETGTNPKNYDLSVALPTPPDSVELKCTITWDNPVVNSGSVTYAITSVVTSGTKFQEPTIAANDPSNGNWTNLNNVTKVSDFFTGSADNNYKVIVNTSRQGTLSDLRTSGFSFTCESFGQDTADGEFYLRFVYTSSGSYVPRVNYLMAGYKEELTIVISE